MKIAMYPAFGDEVMTDYLESEGCQIVTITDGMEAYQADFDRLLLLGGADISPYLYGEMIVHADKPSKNRDITEWILIRRAMTEKIPTLGICRGHQMIAIAHGASLYQDIKAATGIQHGYLDHKLHNVDQRLRQHIPETHVNSIHHQAVKNAPHGFDVTASTKSGLIESIYRPGFLGVQWHPEMLYQFGNYGWAMLFEWFLDGLN